LQQRQLNEKEIKAAKPEAKRRRLPDGHGLFLEVMPCGAKFWRQMGNPPTFNGAQP
jgi:hypothetical protein